MQLKFAEIPHVHVGGFSVAYVLKRSGNLIGHIWHPFFSEETGTAEYIHALPKVQKKITEAKNPSTRTILKKRVTLEFMRKAEG